MNAYLVLKHTHIFCAGLSISLFILRCAWKAGAPQRLQQRWVRILPHAIDTIFLGTGLALAATIHQYPFVAGWLTAKVFGLIAYIVLGTLALKRTSGAAFVASAIGAVLVFCYIAGVAIADDPMSWMALAR